MSNYQSNNHNNTSKNRKCDEYCTDTVFEGRAIVALVTAADINGNRKYVYSVSINVVSLECTRREKRCIFFSYLSNHMDASARCSSIKQF
jgi:hypothetical protein